MKKILTLCLLFFTSIGVVDCSTDPIENEVSLLSATNNPFEVVTDYTHCDINYVYGNYARFSCDGRAGYYFLTWKNYNQEYFLNEKLFQFFTQVTYSMVDDFGSTFAEFSPSSFADYNSNLFSNNSSIVYVESDLEKFTYSLSQVGIGDYFEYGTFEIHYASIEAVEGNTSNVTAEKTVYSSQNLDAYGVLEGLTVLDDIDGDITDSLEITFDSYTKGKDTAGEYLIEFKATDLSGNEIIGGVKVIVIDDHAPIFTNEDIEYSISYASGFDVSNIINQLTAVDYLGNDISSSIRLVSDEYSFDSSSLGPKIIKYAVTDVLGKTTEYDVIINVYDDVPPYFVFNGSFIILNKGESYSITDLFQMTCHVNELNPNDYVIIDTVDSINKDKIGTYEIRFTIESLNGDEEPTLTQMVKVVATSTETDVEVDSTFTFKRSDNIILFDIVLTAFGLIFVAIIGGVLTLLVKDKPVVNNYNNKKKYKNYNNKRRY